MFSSRCIPDNEKTSKSLLRCPLTRLRLPRPCSIWSTKESASIRERFGRPSACVKSEPPQVIHAPRLDARLNQESGKLIVAAASLRRAEAESSTVDLLRPDSALSRHPAEMHARQVMIRENPLKADLRKAVTEDHVRPHSE